MTKLSDRDFIEAANELGCEFAAIKAVAIVEAAGDAFLGNGEPKILFEAHHFSRLTNHKYDVTHPRISSKEWNRKLYLGGTGEHRRLATAIALDREAALKATSWGLFQLMGFNYKECGFNDLQSFINAMYRSEADQLQAFVGFIRHDPRLVQAIQKKQWDKFAKIYNGPGYKVNKYDRKLEQAYKRLLN